MALHARCWRNVKAEAAGKWKDGTGWREVGRRLAFEHLIQQHFDPLKPRKFPRRRREYIRTRAHVSVVSAVCIIIYAVGQLGLEEVTKEGRNFVSGNQRISASSGLRSRYPSGAESVPVTVDLLKSLTSTSFRSEGRYYQFHAVDANDDQWRSYECDSETFFHVIAIRKSRIL